MPPHDAGAGNSPVNCLTQGPSDKSNIIAAAMRHNNRPPKAKSALQRRAGKCLFGKGIESRHGGPGFCRWLRAPCRRLLNVGAVPAAAKHGIVGPTFSSGPRRTRSSLSIVSTLASNDRRRRSAADGCWSSDTWSLGIRRSASISGSDSVLGRRRNGYGRDGLMLRSRRRRQTRYRD